MKTIEERALDFVEKLGIDHYSPLFDVCQEDYRVGAIEQKAIDDAELLNLRSSWEKEAQINHNDENNYKQGYHDAVEKACKWLKKELRKLAIDELKDNFLENEFKFVLKSQIPTWLINLRKAMEE